jgi:hypothetical protein
MLISALSMVFKHCSDPISHHLPHPGTMELTHTRNHIHLYYIKNNKRVFLQRLKKEM